MHQSQVYWLKKHVHETLSNNPNIHIILLLRISVLPTTHSIIICNCFSMFDGTSIIFIFQTTMAILFGGFLLLGKYTPLHTLDFWNESSLLFSGFPCKHKFTNF